MLRVLANATRLAILNHLIEGERSVAQIEQALHIGQPVLSQQLAELREAGALVARRQGKSVFYRLQAGTMTNLIQLVCAVADGNGTAALNAGARNPAQAVPMPHYE
jgi:DNA-binding transcriptional ArsR family regulator